MRISYFVLLLLLFSSGCSSTPEPYSESNINTSSNNFTEVPSLTPSSTSLESSNLSESLSFAEQEREKRLDAKGGGIFDFHDLTATNCDTLILEYADLNDETERDLKSEQSDLAKYQKNLAEAEADLRAAEQGEDKHAQERIRKTIDRAEEDVADTEDLVKDTTDYLRKLKIVFSTMKDECRLLKAKA